MQAMAAASVGAIEHTSITAPVSLGRAANRVFFYDIEHLFEARSGIDVIGAALGQLTGGCGGGV